MTSVMVPCAYCGAPGKMTDACLACWRRAGVCITDTAHPLHVHRSLTTLIFLGPGLGTTHTVNPPRYATGD